MKKFFLILSFIFLILFLWIKFDRKIYCINDNKCITLWKTSKGTYIIPGKYRSLFKPKDNYILSENKGYLDLIWINNSIIILGSMNYKIYNKDKFNLLITNYKDNLIENDKKFTYKKNHYNYYKKNIIFLSIDLLEGDVTTNEGKVLD